MEQGMPMLSCHTDPHWNISAFGCSAQNDKSSCSLEHKPMYLLTYPVIYSTWHIILVANAIGICILSEKSQHIRIRLVDRQRFCHVCKTHDATNQTQLIVCHLCPSVWRVILHDFNRIFFQNTNFSLQLEALKASQRQMQSSGYASRDLLSKLEKQKQKTHLSQTRMN